MAKDNDLEALAEQLPAMAAECGLILLPGIPEESPVLVDLDEADITPRQLCEAATATGAKVLFHRTTVFDADGFLDEHDPLADVDLDVETPVPPAVTELRRRARRRDGRLALLQLCVVADGIPIVWSQEQDWASELVASARELAVEAAQAAREDQARARENVQAEADRIAKLLQDLPDFRAATSEAARRRIAEHAHPCHDENDPDHWRRVMWRAVPQATAAVEATARDTFATYARELPRLAEELLATGRLADARTLQVRKIHVQDFLRERSGGYTPPRELVTLMLEQPEVRKPARVAAGRQVEDLFAAAAV